MPTARSVWLLATITLSQCLGASPSSIEAPQPASAQRSYRLKLGAFAVAAGPSVGLIVRARINGGPPLRLLLDSGSQYVVLDRKTAGKSGCTGGSELDLVGAGSPAPGTAKALTAETIEIGDFSLRNVPMLITAHRIADGIDGAIPLSLFAGFLIRLDVPTRTLDLLPYPPRQAEAGGAVQAVSVNQLLFLRGVFDETCEGYFLLDTGAAYNAVSQELSQKLNRFKALAPTLVPVQGGTTAMDAPLFRDTAKLRFGSRELVSGPVVTIDLSTASRYHNLEVSGLIGYPALRDSVLTVNYRDRLVRIDPR